MKVVWDLDGVLRDLCGYICSRRGCPYPDKWDYLYNGKSLNDIVNEDITILENSPATAYKSVAKSHYPHPEIWTNQPERWRVPTMQWINKHLGSGAVVHFLTTEEKEERLKREDRIVLIEDSPLFTDYENIVLIDRPYNQHIKGVMRIFGTRHLENMLEIIKEHG